MKYINIKIIGAIASMMALTRIAEA